MTVEISITASDIVAAVGHGAFVGLEDIAEKIVDAANEAGNDAVTEAIGTAYSADHDGANPLKLGTYTLWVDATGDLRIVDGTPSSDTDGTVVGAQTA